MGEADFISATAVKLNLLVKAWTTDYRVYLIEIKP